MFFVISKLINVFLSPFILFLVLFGISILINNNKLRMKLLLISLIMLLFFSNGLIVQGVMKSMEYPIVPERKLDTCFDYGILLGGFSGYFEDNDRMQLNCAGDRLFQTMDLYNKGYIRKIIVSGGSGRVLEQASKEADWVKQYLVNNGVPESHVLIENNSKNTHENALNVSQMYGNDTSTYMLITSAFHMKRAAGCFKKAGLDVFSYPVHFMVDPEKPKGYFINGMVPSAMAMNSWGLIFKEWIGTWVYKLKGYV